MRVLSCASNSYYDERWQGQGKKYKTNTPFLVQITHHCRHLSPLKKMMPSFSQALKSAYWWEGFRWLGHVRASITVGIVLKSVEIQIRCQNTHKRPLITNLRPFPVFFILSQKNYKQKTDINSINYHLISLLYVKFWQRKGPTRDTGTKMIINVQYAR